MDAQAPLPETVLLIGQAATCRRLEQQLEMLLDRPLSLGWVLTDSEVTLEAILPKECLGPARDLEKIAGAFQPDAALISLPVAMTELTQSLRTRLRRIGVADRVFPTIEDMLAGVGPRTHLEIDYEELLDRPPRQIDIPAVANVIHGRRVLITGAGGSIGSELARLAADFGPEQLVLIDRSENALFEIDRQIAMRAPEVDRVALLHDVVDSNATCEHFLHFKPHLVFHAAAHKHVPMMEDHPAEAVRNNFHGTKSAADAAHAAGVERFVMISTDKAVNPSSIMGATKRLAELYVQHVHRFSPTAYAMVRFGNVLGSSGSVLETWSNQIAAGGPVTVTDPRMMRYFMTIPEAASLVIQSAALMDADAPAGEVLLLDMGEPVPILELAQRFISLNGLRPVVAEAAHRPGNEPGTILIVFTGTRPGEKLHEELRFDEETMRPSGHPDINIWALRPPDPQYVDSMVRGLDIRPGELSQEQLIARIRSLVPEMVERAPASYDAGSNPPAGMDGLDPAAKPNAHGRRQIAARFDRRNARNETP